MLELTIGEGRKRQVRRMCEAVGHPVEELERVAFGPLRLGGLAVGEARLLTARRGRALGGARLEERRQESGAMKLRALRGAITVDANDGDAILDATEELMRAVLEQNSLDAEDLVSCIFTAPRPRRGVPGGRREAMGLSAVPLLCAHEIDVPGALPRVIRILVHCYADDPRRRSTSTCARPSRCARTSGRAMTGIEFNSSIATSRSTRPRRPTATTAS